MKKLGYRRILRAIHRYLLFFLIVAFAITCCMMLFLTVMSQTLGVELTDTNLNVAAKLTFLNVILISLLLTTADAVRRKLTVELPVKRITDAAKKMAEGDFSVRISTVGALGADEHFKEIIDCFNRLAEELSGTETLRADFVANVSHELKTPLTVMQNYATMLQQPNLPEETRVEYAKSISDASGRLSHLITNILKLNKLENQQITPSTAPYDLSEQICECLLDFEEVWEKKGIEIETDIEDNVLVRSDAEMLSLVWNNLFSNAMKFTEQGGTVSVCVRTEGELAVVRVSDTGCGISQEIGAHMFDQFYQGDTSHATEGNGLGLALVKRVVDLTQSDISVESELGHGTTFTVKMRRNLDGNA